VIVKVQLSLASSAEMRRVLVYNLSRSVEWEGDAGADVLRVMGNRVKAYFHATVRGTLVHLGKEAPEQSW